jgi:hypothetical protein
MVSEAELGGKQLRGTRETCLKQSGLYLVGWRIKNSAYNASAPPAKERRDIVGSIITSAQPYSSLRVAVLYLRRGRWTLVHKG